MSSDALDLLNAGKIEEFNATRQRRATLDLFAADLSNLSLAGVDLSGVNLQKADLSGTDLSGAVLARSDLSGADLTGANLSGIMALQSKWREAYLGDADLSDADLQKADLTEADLTSARAPRARLGGARLKNAILVGADLSESDLAEARLSGADLTGANLSGAVLREAEVARANLTKAKLVGADLTRARMANAALREADLSEANLQSADLTAADLSHAVVTGADFTRADLTEAVLEGVPLTKAVLTFAELDASAPAEAPAEPPPAKILIEEASIAISGDRVAVLWENDEGQGAARLRLAVGKLGGSASPTPISVPLPPDLVLSRSVVPTVEGFSLVALLERPGGLVASVGEIGADGQLSALRSMKLPYTPATRPVVRAEGGEVILYGISREGPGLQVHRVDADAVTRIHASPMQTVRGFAGALYPVILSKGGVLVLLSREGAGQPMRAPSGFPGRVFTAGPFGGGLVLAWAEPEKSGFFLAVVKPGGTPEEMRLLPKVPIGALDLVEHGGRIWVLFTREDPRGRAPTSAWAVRLPDGDPIPVLNNPALDVAEVHFCQGGDLPVAAVTTLDGELHLVALTPQGAKPVWKIGGA